VAANAVLGYTVDHFGWDGGFILLIGSCVVSIICLTYSLLGEKAHHEAKLKESQQQDAKLEEKQALS
jgi:OPA family glycerol-3-phosphate transporter-like MFS transporter